MKVFCFVVNVVLKQNSMEDKYFDIDYMKRWSHEVEMSFKKLAFEQYMEWQKQINRNNIIGNVVRFTECDCSCDEMNK